jgi:hypothetical protein
MARSPSDREDLLREATALLARGEIALVGQPEPVVAGFRRDGAASFYFGSDPVVQFDLALRVRRGFYHGDLLKAEQGRLVALTRHRTATETQLLREEWTDEQTGLYLADMRGRLVELTDQLKRRAARIIGAVPSVDDVIPRLQEWLAALPASLDVANSPGLKR